MNIWPIGVASFVNCDSQVVLALGDYMGVLCHACIGGTNVQQDIRVLEAGQHVVVGTPGRVYDMINRQALDPRWVDPSAARGNLGSR